MKKMKILDTNASVSRSTPPADVTYSPCGVKDPPEKCARSHDGNEPETTRFVRRKEKSFPGRRSLRGTDGRWIHSVINQTGEARGTQSTYKHKIHQNLIIVHQNIPDLTPKSQSLVIINFSGADLMHRNRARMSAGPETAESRALWIGDY